MSIVLLIKSTQDAESIEVNEGQYSLGRSRKSDIKVDDDKISGQHILILVKNNGIFIKDNDSTNGTFLNGNRIDSREVLLGIRDEIQIGNTYISIDEKSLNSIELKKFNSQSQNTRINFIEPKTEQISSPEEKDNIEENDKASEVINFDFNLDESIKQNTDKETDPDKTYLSSHFNINNSDNTKEITTENLETDTISDETRTNYIMDADDINNTPNELTLVKKPEVKKIKRPNFAKKQSEDKNKKRGFLSKLFKKF